MQKYAPEILFEDNHLLIVNKPGGMPVQGDNSNDLCLLDYFKDFIKKRDNKPGNVYLGLPHRLDRPVSGVVVLAKTSKALPRLNKLFASKDIKKTYHAIVAKTPTPKAGVLNHYLLRNQKQNKSFVVDKNNKNAKEAILEYTQIGKSDRFYLLEINLLTGRHHQIRAQLSAIGCPIKGDLKYGSPRSNPDGNISLHAHKIEFIHPVKKTEVVITAPYPQDKIWTFFIR